MWPEFKKQTKIISLERLASLRMHMRLGSEYNNEVINKLAL